MTLLNNRSPRPPRAAMAGLLIFLLALVAPIGVASAQDPSDPYGSTSTTAPVDVSASCELSTTRASAGASVIATVHNVPIGGTVRVLFGGVEVGRGTASAQATSQAVGGAVVFGGAAQAAGVATSSVQIAFTVPDVPPGSYLVSAVGDTFTCQCSPETGGRFSVLAASVSQGGGGGGLPKTGAYVALLVAVALGLLVVGRSFVEASRRRRRRAARQGRAAARHLVEAGSPQE